METGNKKVAAVECRQRGYGSETRFAERTRAQGPHRPTLPWTDWRVL